MNYEKEIKRIIKESKENVIIGRRDYKNSKRELLKLIDKPLRENAKTLLENMFYSNGLFHTALATLLFNGIEMEGLK